MFRAAILSIGLIVASAPAGALSPEWTRCVNDDDAFLPDVAISACTALIQSGKETRNNLAIAYNNRGNAYWDKGDDDRAIADYNKAIELDPKYAIAYNNRGYVYSAMGEYDRAIADHSRAIELDPKDAYPYNDRGAAYYGKKDYDRAIADFNKAIELDPKLAIAYYDRAVVYEKLGDKDRAIADYRRGLPLAPNDPDYAKAFKRLGASP